MNEKTISKNTHSDWKSIVKVAGIAAFIQLGYIIVVFAIELPVVAGSGFDTPESALDFFTIITEDPLAAICFLDVPMYLLLFMAYFTSFGLYGILRRKNEAVSVLLTALIFVSVTLALATSDVLSLFHLSGRFAAASTESMRQQLLAAGEAVIASNLWHSTAGYFVGIMMQGPFLIFSIMMMRGTSFKRRTAYTGILANGLDLLQHLIHIFVPSIASSILMISGIFYIPWFLFLGLDFIRIERKKLV